MPDRCIKRCAYISYSVVWSARLAVLCTMRYLLFLVRRRPEWHRSLAEHVFFLTNHTGRFVFITNVSPKSAYVEGLLQSGSHFTEIRMGCDGLSYDPSNYLCNSLSI
jgi:hypothetical protein